VAEMVNWHALVHAQVGRLELLERVKIARGTPIRKGVGLVCGIRHPGAPWPEGGQDTVETRVRKTSISAVARSKRHRVLLGSYEKGHVADV